MNSHPGASQSYFRVGTDDYFLNFDSSGKLTLKVTNFDLIAGSDNNTIKITSNSESNPIDVGNGQFKVTWAGKVIAQNAEIHGSIYANYIEAITGGKIGGWTITKDSLSKGGAVLHGTNGTITLGASAGADSGTYFHVSNAGFLTATGAELTTLVVKGKAHFTSTSYIGINVTPNSAYDLYVNGKTYLRGNIGIGIAPNDNWGLRVNGDTRIGGNLGIGTDPVDDYDVKATGDIYIGGKIYLGGTSTWLQLYSNGIWFEGNLLTFNTSYIQVGQGGNTCTMTFLGGSTFQMGANSEFKLLSGSKAYFSDPENILVDGTMTLDEYVREAAGIINIGTAKTVGYAQTASKIGSNASTWTSLGSATKPVYLNNGVFTECDSYPSGVPSYSTSNNGQVLKVVNGALSWSTDNDTKAWSSITGKPTTFTPKSHDHTGTSHRHKIIINGTTYYTEYTSMVLSGP